MWIIVVNFNGNAINNAQFSHNYQNYGNGQYWVAVGQNQVVTVRAPGYQEASGFTDAYDSLRVTLASTGGGGKK